MVWLRRRGRSETRAELKLADVIGFDRPDDFAHIGQRVDADRAMRLSAVWACVRLLADTISTFPLDVYRRAPGGTAEQVATPPLFATPAAGVALHEWLYQVVVSLLLRGNAYGIVTARAGAAMRPVQIEIVNPDLVTVTVAPDGTISYRYRGQPIDRADVWHVRAFAFPGSPVGLSPVAYAAASIGVGLAATRYAGQFFEDGAHPTGLLTSESVLTAEHATTAKERFMAATRGKREPVVLGNGMQYKPLQIAPEDAQLLDVQRFTVSEVARIYGVPPEMIGGEAGNSLTYANVEGRALDYLRYSVNPWVVRLETALGQLVPRNQYVKLNPGALLRSTTAERYEAHRIALDAGFLTIDEVRALEDLPPLPPQEPGIAA